MGIVIELLRMIVAGLAGFVVLLLLPLYYLVLLALGLVSSLSLMIALFCGVGYLFQPTTHNLLNALGFLGYSAAAFTFGLGADRASKRSSACLPHNGSSS